MRPNPAACKARIRSEDGPPRSLPGIQHVFRQNPGWPLLTPCVLGCCGETVHER